MKRELLILVLLGVGLGLGGCAGQFGSGIGGTNSAMTPEQVKAWVADKNASAVCLQIIAPTGNVKFVAVNLDKGTVPNGVVTVDPNSCAVAMSNETPVKAPAVPK